MSKTPVVLLQQRDFGEKINATFEFVRQNGKSLALCLLYIGGPAALLAGIAQGMYQSKLSVSASSFGELWGYYGNYLISMALTWISTLMTSLAVAAYFVLYEELGADVEITPAMVWQKILERLGTSIGAILLAMVLTIVGLVLFVLPGIYVAIAMQFVQIIALRETDASADEVMARSHQLTRGHWWESFGLIFVISFVAGILAIAFNLPTYIIAGLSAATLQQDFSISSYWRIAAGVLSTLGGCFGNGLICIAIIFQYYNLTEARDGSGILAEIDTIGSDDPYRNQFS